MNSDKATSALSPLSRVLERHVLSFLDVDESLGNAVRVSKQWSSLVHDFARLMRTLVISKRAECDETDAKTVHPTLEMRRVALDVALASCRSLTELIIADREVGFTVSSDRWNSTEDPEYEDYCRRCDLTLPKRQALVTALVTHNPSLRIVDICNAHEPLISPEFFVALRACKELRSVRPQARRYGEDSHHLLEPAADVPRHWPKLEELLFSDTWRDTEAKKALGGSKLAFLSLGLPLRRLHLGYVCSIDLLQSLSHPAHLQLAKLHVAVDLNPDMVSSRVSMLHEVGKQLSALTCLTDLSVELLESRPTSAEVSELRSLNHGADPVWRLPNVTKLRLQGHHCEWLPRFAAPEVTELDLYPHDWPLLLRVFHEFPNLRRLNCYIFETYFPEPELCNDSCDRFTAAVRNGAWPQMQNFSLRHTLPVTFCAAAPHWLHLKSLCLTLHPPFDLSYVDAMMQRFTALSQLEKLEVRGPPSFARLRADHHGPDVQSLEPEARDSTTLRSLPSLRSLHLDFAREATFDRLQFPSLTKLRLGGPFVKLHNLRDLLLRAPKLSVLESNTFCDNDGHATEIRWCAEPAGAAETLRLASLQEVGFSLNTPTAQEVLSLLAAAPNLTKLNAAARHGKQTTALLLALAAPETPVPTSLKVLELNLRINARQKEAGQAEPDWASAVVAIAKRCPQLDRLTVSHESRIHDLLNLQAAQQRVRRELQRPRFSVCDEEEDD